MAAVFAINDPSALGAWRAIKDVNKTDQIKIVGFDGFTEGKEAIRDGKIYADPIQFPTKMAKETVAIQNTRNIGKQDLKLNDATPEVEVHPETYEVRADGELLTCQPATELPMAQRYFLF